MAERMRKPERGRVDPLAMVVGVLALLVAGFGITGTSRVGVVDLRWVLAGAAVVGGLALLVAGLRNSRATSDD